MSEFSVEVVRVGQITKHPNADTLSITNVFGGYPVIFRSGDYQPGDLAAYIPIDSIVPADDARWDFLAGHRRIKAKKLRGVFSMGMLTPAEAGWTEGQNVQAELRIEKYEPQIAGHATGGEAEHDASGMPHYTDIEGLRKHGRVLVPGEEVAITEKIHGANARFVYHSDRLWVGSRTQIKLANADNMWWKVAAAYQLEDKLRNYPNVAIFGEVYGQVQDLKYGAKPGELKLALFDAMDIATRRYYDYDDFMLLAVMLGLPTAPELFRGPWSEDLRSMCEGPSTMPGADHMREGIVIKPLRERTEHMGRVVLKLIGQEYLLRKGA